MVIDQLAEKIVGLKEVVRMKDVKESELLTKVDSQFKLVVMAAKRVKALSHGAQRLADEGDPNLIRVALTEIVNGKITYQNEKSQS